MPVTALPATAQEAPAQPGKSPVVLPRWIDPAGWALYAAVAWLFLLAFPHGMPLPNLDQSWSAIVTKASAEHWQFGRQIMLNYGPWSHLGIGFYNSELFTTDYIFQILSRVLIVALICRASRPLPIAGRCLFLLANVVAGVLEWETIQLLAVVYTGWLLSEDATRPGRLLGYAGLTLAAAAALMKTFFLIFTLGACGCVLARHLWRGGRTAVWAGIAPMGAFVVFCLAGWLLAGQGFGTLFDYLRGAFELMGGHPRAMGYDSAPDVLWMSVAILAWMGVVCLVLLAGGDRARLSAMLPLAALFAGSLFMSWKQGFARADGFHVSAYLCFVAVAVTALPLFFDRRAFVPALYYLSIGIVWVLAVATMAKTRPAQGAHLAEEWQTRPWRNLRILFAPEAERARLDAEVQHLRELCALPEITVAVGRSRVDVFGSVQVEALLNDWNYAPVPTLQGFVAYTPYLADLNARCYEPGRAPEFVLFEGGSIGNRWPALDGARQLRELLWNYQAVLMERRFLLLERKSAAACVSPQPVLQQSGEFALDQPLDLPADGADWCELEVRETLPGKLINFFYHQPALLMEVTTADGQRRRWDLPPIMAKQGFLLRQGPRSLEDVLRLLAGESIRSPVTAIRLVGSPGLRRAIQPMVAYRFYRLEPIKPAVE